MSDEETSALQKRVDGIFLEQPVFEYALVAAQELSFSDKVRYICENECDRYGKSWICGEHMPPLELCMARCLEFSHAVVFSTVSDGSGFSEQLAARRGHEEVTDCIAAGFEREFGEVLTLSTGCMLCESCAYPEPCRHPSKRRSTTESHGILILNTAARHGLSFDCGENIVTYFSLVLFNA